MVPGEVRQRGEPGDIPERRVRKVSKRALFSSFRGDWRTSHKLYLHLNEEFKFNFDPCPPEPKDDGLFVSWNRKRVYCNPPYGKNIGDWIMKAKEADIAVFNLPARTDTEWFHYCLSEADEIRFLRGRLKFQGATNSAPFPSVIIIFRKHDD